MSEKRYRCTECDKVVENPTKRENIPNFEAWGRKSSFFPGRKKGIDLLEPMDDVEYNDYSKQLEEDIENTRKKMLELYWHKAWVKNNFGCGHGRKAVWCGPLKEEEVNQLYAAFEHLIGEKV